MPARANFKRQGFILAPHGTGNRRKPVSCTPSQEAELGGRLVFRSLVLFILPHTRRPESHRQTFPEACLLGDSRARQVDNINHHTTEGGRVRGAVRYWDSLQADFHQI